MEGLLYTHDRIAGLKMDSGPQFVLEDDALLRRLGNYSEPNIKIVRIEKTSEPLGATVRNEDDAVVVGRIMRGGTAEASGLLHEGDEVLEVSKRRCFPAISLQINHSNVIGIFECFAACTLYRNEYEIILHHR